MKHFLLSLALLMVSCSAVGQSTSDGEKVPLDHEDFDQWRSISNAEFSRDGSLVYYGLNPQEGDGELMLHDLDSGDEISFERARNFELNYSGSTMVWFIQAPYADRRQARIDGDDPSEIFDDTLAVYSIADEMLEKFAEVDSYKMPEESGRWLAFLYDRELEEEEAEEDSAETGEDESTDEASEDDAMSEQTENDLVLRNLETGAERIIPYVEEYHFSEGGERLVYRTAPADSLDLPGGLFVMMLDEGETMHISENLESYTSVRMDSSASQITFLAMPEATEEEEGGESENDENGEDDAESEEEEEEDQTPDYYGLYYWTDGMETARLIADESADWLSEEWMINEYASPRFSEDGSRLLFGTAPEPMRRDTTVAEIDMASVDVWHWQDERLQPRQLLQLRQDRRKTYDAVWHITDERFVQMADNDMENLIIPDEGNAPMGIGLEGRQYEHLTQWEGFPALTDVYLVDIGTGERELFKERIKASTSISPDGHYFAWYDFADQNWYSYNFETGREVNLTSHLDVAFYDELNDRPMDPYPYGVEGWTEGDEHIVIRDRFDLWVFNPDEENGGYMLTGGRGRAQELTYRSFKADRDSRYIEENPLYLDAMYESDKSFSLHRAVLRNDDAPEELWRGDMRAYTPQKAENADQWMIRLSTFQQYPDIFLTDSDFDSFEKLSEANPQQDNYLWGDVELFTFDSLDGVELDGLLYTPENFDPEQKYPMIIYFYERTSDRLHNYRAPAPSASTITPAFYTSRGYVVAMPDIVYKEGQPGRSAEDAVIGMTLHLLDEGFIDRDRMALQGQSWGGYQIAHIVTRTDMYAAAMAGAPVVNMTSAYGGIRWGSGLNRQFQYEQTQSRIGGSLWERPRDYMRNSPLFYADQVSTPLLMMHNDADGAVPWYQGIEFFTALKRLQQPVWMLNYNDEAHNLRERVNRKDLSRRMQQFFDHYLMDAPMPVWMKHGVPAIEKGKHQGFELVD
jgi:dipeptidyl aminopeptidase/acylaminoacyl peptidase